MSGRSAVQPSFTSWLRIPVLSIKQACWALESDVTVAPARLYRHAQPNIPITTAPPCKYSQHTSPIFFFHKTIFQNFVGSFQGPQGLLPTIFEFPFSRHIPSHFVPTFDIHSHFLLHCIQPPDDYSTSC